MAILSHCRYILTPPALEHFFRCSLITANTHRHDVEKEEIFKLNTTSFRIAFRLHFRDIIIKNRNSLHIPRTAGLDVRILEAS